MDTNQVTAWFRLLLFAFLAGALEANMTISLSLVGYIGEYLREQVRGRGMRNRGGATAAAFWKCFNPTSHAALLSFFLVLVRADSTDLRGGVEAEKGWGE